MARKTNQKWLHRAFRLASRVARPAILKKPGNLKATAADATISDVFSSASARPQRFVPRIAQCSIVGGLKIGWISGLPSENKQPQSVEDLFRGRPLTFSFVARSGVETIEIQFGTYGRRVSGRLNSRILDEAGRAVSETLLPLCSVEDNQYTTVHDLRSVTLIPGKSYSIELQSSARKVKKIAVWGNVCPPRDDATPVLVTVVLDRTFATPYRKSRITKVRTALVAGDAISRDFLQDLLPLSRGAEPPLVVNLRDLFSSWPKLVETDVVFFKDYDKSATGCRLDQLCFPLHRSGAITVAAIGDDTRPAWSSACHYTLSCGSKKFLHDNLGGALVGPIDGVDLERIVDENVDRSSPSLTVLYWGSRSTAANHKGRLVASQLGVAKLDLKYVSDERDQSLRQLIETSLASEEDVAMLVGPDFDVWSDLLTTHIFEHWYRDVEVVASSSGLADGAADNGRLEFDGCEQLLSASRVFSLKGHSARLDAIAALSNSDCDFHRAASELGKRLEARSAIVRKSDVSASARDHRPHATDISVRRGVAGWLSEAAAKGFGSRFPRRSVNIASSRALRVLSYRWHAAHQYEIFKLPFEFTLVRGFSGHITENWPYSERPMRSNVRFRFRSEIDARDYDVCLIHFDENVLCPELSNGILPANWGEPFSWLLSLEGLPKVGVCHGTPPFRGQYAQDPARKTEFDVFEDQRAKLASVLATADALVVCNSWQAKSEWRFENSRVIWHGFDPTEFREGSHTHNILTLRHDLTRPHYRGYFEQLEVEERLHPTLAVTHGGQVETPIEVRTTNAYAVRQFDSYIKRIGQFRFYLNTTLRSPMPRSRGEAMMTGVVPICLANHDVEQFIDNGVDGLYAAKPSDLASFLNSMTRDEQSISRMCVAARRKAIDVFHCHRFQSDWQQLLEDRLGRRLSRVRRIQ